MSKEVVKHEEMMEVLITGGDIYYINAKDKNNLLQVMNKQKFVELDGDIISCSSIKSIKSIKNYREVVLKSYSIDIRNAVKERAKDFYMNTGRMPKEEKYLEWAEKLNNGYSIN